MLGFATTHQALDAERVLLECGVTAKLIPAPIELGGALCGIALRVPAEKSEEAENCLSRASLPAEATVRMEDY